MQITISRRQLFTAVIAVLLVVPAVAFAGTIFDDVDDSHAHIGGMEFMKTSGVSIGCDTNNNYCPERNVTRAQMGTFMYRLSGNDPSTLPSVNAASVDGFSANEMARVASSQVSTDVDDWTGLTITDSVDIDTESSGMLIITYVVNAGVDSNETDTGLHRYTMVPKLDTVATDGGTWGSLDFDTDEDVTWTVQRVVAVDADSHTVSVSLDRYTGTSATALTYIYDRSLTVLFVPFDGTGSSPLGTFVPAPEPSGRQN